MPSFSLLGGSMPMPTLRAAAWMVSKSPVRPTKSASWAAQPRAERLGGVALGVGGDEDDPELALFGLGERFVAMAMLLIVSGQTSGQLV